MSKKELFIWLRSCYLYRLYRVIKNIKKSAVFLRQCYPSLSDDEFKKVLLKQRKSLIKYQIGHVEFFWLRCEDKSLDEIKDYFSYNESTSFCMSVNSSNAIRTLYNKYAAYKLFSKYYGRKVEYISQDDLLNGEAIKKLNSFVNGDASSYIVKPLNLNSGVGIKILSSISEIMEYLKSLQKGGIIEELIIQDESMAAFNPSSVNTLRMNTVNYGNGDVEVIWPCLRVGRAGHIVDNAGSGGIFAAIDITTGKTLAAIDESRTTWTVHPDSNKALIGFTIPRWEEAVALAKELAKTLPDAGFVGWDLALTKNGWVMVEGNASPLIIYQIAVAKGLRPELCRIKEKFECQKRSPRV